MDQQHLSAVLVDFARALTRDLSVERTLHYLTAGVLEAIPVSGAGLLLMDTERNHHLLAATDDAFAGIAALQLELGEGPCLAAYRTGRPVAIPDLTADAVFPRFSQRARDAGLATVYSFPLLVDGAALGALELYSDTAVELPAEDVAGAQTLADVVAAYVFNARARSASQEFVEVLQAGRCTTRSPGSRTGGCSGTDSTRHWQSRFGLRPAWDCCSSTSTR